MLTLPVEHEVRVRGPLPARQLHDRGTVEPLDWSGWKPTGTITSMALAVCGRGVGASATTFPSAR